MKIRYVGEESRQVSILPHGMLRLVEPQEVFDVPDAHVASYECQPDLYEVQAAKKTAGKAES